MKVNWKIAGAAGHGIKSVGSIMARALLRHGYYVFGYDEYPSLIRGGHNTYQLLISDEAVFAPQKKVDVLLALNEDGVRNHLKELTEDSKIFKDEGTKAEAEIGEVIDLPILKTAKDLGNPLVQNTILLGVTAGHFGLRDEVMKDLIKEEFSKKEALVELNLRAYDEGKLMSAGKPTTTLPTVTLDEDRLVMTGSEAAGLGAIAAGVQAYFAYPMTPSSPLLHFMAAHQEEFNYLVRQPEDEIAAINMAIGASYAGVKAMVGTAGGGFALMQESVSLLGILELPMVIYVGMRPGPATGLPTWTSQADLKFVIHSGHGEFPKIVLSPGDSEEAFEMVYRAFELSQRYQVTVVVLSDKMLAESDFVSKTLPQLSTVKLQNIDWLPKQPEGELYHRYQPSTDGVGLRTLPGMANGFYIANSDEHGPQGLVDESAEMREVMNTRRLNKMSLIKSEAAMPKVYGSGSEKNCIAAFGSTKGSVLEAMKKVKGVDLYHFTQVWPLNDGIKDLLKEKKVFVIEGNETGQFAGLLSEKGIEVAGRLNKDDGRPFYPEEIIEFLNKNL